jgi:hypothetical protein
VPPSSTSALRKTESYAWVKKLVERDRLSGLEALLEVASFEHLRHAVLRREAHPPEAAQRLEPLAVESHLRLLRVENLEDLGLVRLGVVLDVFRRQRWPRLRAASRIPDERGEGADDVDNGVAEVLKVLHLADEHRVAQVQVRRRRVEPDLDDERAACGGRSLELEAELGGPDHVHTAFGQISELLVNRHG